MKKTDWALVILIVAIVGVASYFVVSAILPAPNENPQTVPTAEPITSDVVTPSKEIFSENSINPTVRVTIGNQSDQPPFTLGEQ